MTGFILKNVYKKAFLLCFSVIFTVITIFLYKTAFNQPEKDIQPILISSISNIDEFLIGSTNCYYNFDFKYIDSALGFTLWHNYDGTVLLGDKHYPDGMTHWAPNDHLFSPISDYQNDVLGLFNLIGSHNLHAWFQRPKIEYLVYGQRSDYRCVDTTYVDHDLWFYTFQSPLHVGTDVPEIQPYGNGNYVRYCRSENSRLPGKKVDNIGYVVGRLRTNGEQSHRSHDFDAYRWDSEHDWYIKPRIRIDSSFAHNNQETQVCEIQVKADDGVTVLKDVILKGKNFLDQNMNYNGRYIEDFYHLYGSDSLIIHGDWGDKWLFASRGNREADTDNNRCDISVFWFGNCDMWIDYIRVDNDVANDLLTDDNSNPKHREYLQWLQWEAQQIACIAGNAPFKFYIELFEFNQIPCIAYVNHALDSLCNKKIDIVPVQFTFYQYHMAWEDRGKIMKPDQIIRQYVNKVGSSEILCGHLPFTSIENNTYSRIPNTLPIHQGQRILAIDAIPSDYDAWLQGNLDTISSFDEGENNGMTKSYYLNSQEPCPQMPQLPGKFRFELQLGGQICKQSNTSFISWAQATQFFVHCGEIEREPTTEEMDLTANVPVSYGAKGIIYFTWDGWDGGINYSYGFVEMDGVTPRYTNVYGQPKWQKFIDIIKRMKKWSPYVMSFDNKETNSYIYRIEEERNSLINNSYIDRIITLKPGDFKTRPNSENVGEYSNNKQMVSDLQNLTYIQAATFKNSSKSDGSLYFMIINKRCSPFIDDLSEDHLGGKRWIEILFKTNHSEMGGSNVWKITDLANPQWTVYFDKTSYSYVDLGAFMPGEGKLYSMSPIGNESPVSFKLFQNYPNPFNPITTIKYTLPKQVKVVIKIFDVLGKEIKTLVNDYRNPGYNVVEFDASNFASGVYFYRIEAGDFVESKKMVFVK